MSLLNIVLLVGLCAIALADVATYYDCDDSSKACAVNELRISPCYGYQGCRIEKGRDVNVNINFTPDFSATDLGVKVYLDGLLFPVAVKNACEFTQCPTSAGQSQNLHFTGSVSEFMIPGTFKLRAKIYNKNNEDDQFCCLRTTVVV